MKHSCLDCIHCAELTSGEYICKPKSLPFKDAVGRIRVRQDRMTTIISERQESKGFFGFFRDSTRCGPEGKNFEQIRYKEEK